MININLEKNGNLIANVDETPLALEPITSTTLEKVGSITVKIHSFGASKQRISCILCIYTNGVKEVPTLVFKGVKDGTLEKRLNKHQDVLKGKIKVKCQINSWVNTDIFSNWIKNTWFRTDKKSLIQELYYLWIGPLHILLKIYYLYLNYIIVLID